MDIHLCMIVVVVVLLLPDMNAGKEAIMLLYEIAWNLCPIVWALTCQIGAVPMPLLFGGTGIRLLELHLRSPIRIEEKIYDMHLQQGAVID
eukprot:8040363-Ditylum_brightwellii.AAC.1